MLVLLSHSFELIEGEQHREIMTRLFGNHELTFGRAGVNGFFLLSGYLILQSWRKNPNLLVFL